MPAVWLLVLAAAGIVLFVKAKGTHPPVPNTGTTNSTLPTTGGTVFSVTTGLPVPGDGYNTPVSQNTPERTYGPTIAQLGVHPALLVTGNNRATGYISWAAQYADSVRGIGIDGTVLFDAPAPDGHAIYAAGSIVDHLNVHGPGGDISVQVYFLTDSNYQSDSSDLINRGIVVANDPIQDVAWPAASWPDDPTISSSLRSAPAEA